MTSTPQWTAYWIAGLTGLASDLLWMILAPLYERGFSVLVTPFICFLGVVLFVQYLRKRSWAYRYSPHYAIGTGSVMALFIGDSDEFFGKYAVAMNIVELGVLAGSVAVLLVYFLPAVRSHFRAEQTNKTMEPTR